MKALLFSLRSLQRDWRAGELQVLGLALVIAVASVSSVGFFTDRVNKAMQTQASTLLAADLIVRGTAPIADEIKQQAKALLLTTTESREFPSVILKGDDTQLVSVKAVGEGYPLRGQVSLSDQPFGTEHFATAVPAVGKVWLDPRLVGLLGYSVGDTLTLGLQDFEITALLAFEPDRGGNMFSFAPRVMFNLEDLPRTGLVTEASRVAYNLLLAGDGAAIEQFKQWARDKQATFNVRVNDVSNARPEMRAALNRSESFLGLAALVAVILSGAAVAVSAQGFSAKQATAAAVMRSFGASRQFVLTTLCLRLLMIALIASLIGIGIGLAVQSVLTDMLANWFVINVPPPSLMPLLAGLLTGLVTLIGFALPPVLRIWDVPVIRVLRDDLDAAPASAWLVSLMGLVSIGLLMVWQAGSVTLAVLVIAGCIAALSALGVVAYLTIIALKHLPGEVLSGWRFGLMSLVRRSQDSTLQLVAFGLGLMALLLLSIIRVDVLNAWQSELPDDAPNFFIVNIQPTDATLVEKYLADKGITSRGFYPMIRGRLVAINETPMTADSFAGNPDVQRLLSREFNLSYAVNNRTDNPIVEGKWWQAGEVGQALYSIEKGIAKDLQVSLGDQLTFRIAGQDVTAVISNVREVQWDSFQVNFFVLGTPAILDKQPATVITSFHLDRARQAELATLVRAFPGITVIDVDALIQRVKGMMDRAALTIEYVFYFTLAAGIVVLMAAVQASRGERVREAALLRALGASRRRVLESLVTEFALVGFIAGMLGATAASGIGWLVSEQIFHLNYHFNPTLWIIGVVGGVIGIGITGLLATRSVLATSPLQSLKK